MSQIFISYSRRDSDFVDQLVLELETRGVDVWVDTGEILAGEAWRRTIVEAIRSCQVFVILISPKSVQSENVTKELTLAEQYDKSVLPIIIQDVEIPPSLDYQLAGLHYQTFAEGGYEENFERLVRSLISLGLEVQPKPVPKPKTDTETEQESPSKAVAAAPLPKPISATPSSTTGNLFQKVPVWLWAVGGLVIIIGLVVVLMSIFGGGTADQPTETLETGFAVIPLEETETPTPTKKPTNTTTKEPTETEEPTETLAPTEILELDLEPTETIPPTFTPTPSITPHDPIIEDDFGVSMVLVGSGPFILGSKDGDSDEKPVSEIILDGFYIDQFEVTNDSYKDCVDQGVCNLPRQLDSQTRIEYFGTRQFANFPVIHVSWDDASDYCRWRDARLPTELEWEKAARGPDGLVYPWGNDFEDGRANHCGGAIFCPGEPDDGYKDTAPVDSFEEGVSPYGAYQMAGNVNEWTADWYDKNFYSSLSDGDENPPGPSSGQSRVIRGGSFGLNAFKLRASNRNSNAPSNDGEYDGLRCAADLP